MDEISEIVGATIRESLEEIQHEALLRLRFVADCRAAWREQDWEFFVDAGILSKRLVDELREAHAREVCPV